MQYRKKLTITFIVFIGFASNSNAAEQNVSAEFWQWYVEYADENGEVFDPLSLQELNTMIAARSRLENTTNEQEDNVRQFADQKQDTDKTQQSSNENKKLKEKQDNKESKVATQELSQP